MARKLKIIENEKHPLDDLKNDERSEEHTSELQSPPYISYAVFCLKKDEIIDKGEK